MQKSGDDFVANERLMKAGSQSRMSAVTAGVSGER